MTEHVHDEALDLIGFEPLTVGDYIPDIEFDVFIPGEKEELTKSSLGAYEGKWLVLFFYPADFTFICPTELEEMAELYPEFQKEGVEVVSVSTDTAFVHKAWHDTSEAIKKITYPMAADANHILSASFGVLI